MAKFPSLSSQKIGTHWNQREFERRAAMMGGGNFVVPAQCVTDFISNRLSGTDIAKTFKVVSNHLVLLWLTWLSVPVTTLPPSSYRLGVRPSNLHELFPPYITEALQQSIIMIDREVWQFLFCVCFMIQIPHVVIHL